MKSASRIAVAVSSEASYKMSEPFVGLETTTLPCSAVGARVGVAVGAFVCVGSAVGAAVGWCEGEGVGADVQGSKPILGLGASPLMTKLELDCCSFSHPLWGGK